MIYPAERGDFPAERVAEAIKAVGLPALVGAVEQQPPQTIGGTGVFVSALREAAILFIEIDCRHHFRIVKQHRLFLLFINRQLLGEIRREDEAFTQCLLDGFRLAIETRFYEELLGFASQRELRIPDPSANPYLALAVQLAAGLDGIEKKADAREPVNTNIWEMSHREKRRLRIDDLPHNLEEACDELEKDDVIKSALGDHIARNFLEAKRQEWREYISQVSQWELDNYLAKY